MNPKTRKETLVVAGGCAAGMSAASKAKRTNPGLQVIAFEKSPHVSYSACGIPYFVADLVRDYRELVSVSPEEFRRARGIEVFTGHEVVEINTMKRRVIAVDLATNLEIARDYDKLVLAVGGRPHLPEISGLNHEHVFTVQTLQDGMRIKQVIDGSRLKSAALIGGGYIGLEMAEAFRKRNLKTAVVERESRILPRFEPEIATRAASELADNGVALYCGATVVGVSTRGDGSLEHVALENGERILADLVLVCAGLRPNIDLATAAGLRRGVTGAVRVDWKMQTCNMNVYAAGDCVEVKNLVSGKPDYAPLGPAANKQGRVAGENIGGGTARFRGVVGTSVFKLFDLEIARTGLGVEQAISAGFQAVGTHVEVLSKAKFFPDAAPLSIVIIFDKRSERLLGAQMIGRNGAAKRIDIFATALTNRMTLADMAHLDLSYAPPFAPVWDPVLVAVNAARGKLRQ